MKCIHYEAEKTTIAKKLGYRSYLEALGPLYAALQSSRKVAEIFGETGAAVRYRLKQLGVKRRGRGGDQRNFRVSS